MARLGFESTSRPGEIDVVPPSWRFDIRLEEDLIEEVIRLVGYDALPAGPALGTLQAKVASESRRGASALRHAMADLGWQETINFSFVDERWERDFAGNPAPIRVVNPIASSLSVMRSSLVGSLVEVLRVNLARKQPRLARLRARQGVRSRRGQRGRPARRRRRAPAASARRPRLRPGRAAAMGRGERSVDFFDVKGDVEALLAPAVARFVAAPHPALHPGRSAAIELDGERIGVIGELHPRWRQAYEIPGNAIVFELDAEALQRRRAGLRAVAEAAVGVARHRDRRSAATSAMRR
jgi:phenylalanyl-tRNA synthetase beta chain